MPASYDWGHPDGEEVLDEHDSRRHDTSFGARSRRLFARVLAYAPDPLLYTHPTVRETGPAQPPDLALDPEGARTITPGQPRDDDGLEAMIGLEPADDDPRKFLLPLPAGLDESDPRLFGMWTYELRFGHKDPWSLARARFGRPLQATGVQHPAPTLPCAASWRRRLLRPLDGAASAPADAAPRKALPVEWDVVANAPFATPVLADGSRVGDGFPHTTIGFLLYAQATQADGSSYRNVLIAHQGATPCGLVPVGVLAPYDCAPPRREPRRHGRLRSVRPAELCPAAHPADLGADEGGAVLLNTRAPLPFHACSATSDVVRRA